MTHLLEIRERLIRFYQNHARIVNVVFRFLLSFLTFFSINQLIGYNPALNSWYVVLAFSVVNTVLPISVLLFLAAAYIVFHVYYVSACLPYPPVTPSKPCYTPASAHRKHSS